MLISLDRKFIFVANLKTASTAIESVLRSTSEIALVESRFDKHLPLNLIEERFFWIFSMIPRDAFFVFGVMRNPIDRMVSLFNSHSDDKFIGSDLYTGNIGFDQFISEWTVRHPDQIEKQFLRFLNSAGNIAANYIISYDNLVDGLSFIASLIQFPELLEINRENVSNKRLKISDLSLKHLTWISNMFYHDFVFIERYCDRVLIHAKDN
jgi:hypothetical protein